MLDLACDGGAKRRRSSRAPRSSRRKAFGLLPINSIKVETEVRITLPPLAIRWRAWRISWRSISPLIDHRQAQLIDVAKMTIKGRRRDPCFPCHFTQAQAGETPLSAKLTECRFHQRTAGFSFVVLLRPSRCMNPSNSPAVTIPEIKTNRFAPIVNDCLRAVSAFMLQKHNDSGLKRSECYHRVYFMYKTGE